MRFTQIKNASIRFKVIILVVALIFIIIGFYGFLRAACIATSSSSPFKSTEMLGLSDAILSLKTAVINFYKVSCRSFCFIAIIMLINSHSSN